MPSSPFSYRSLVGYEAGALGRSIASERSLSLSGVTAPLVTGLPEGGDRCPFEYGRVEVVDDVC